MKTRAQMQIILAAARPDDELSIKRWSEVVTYINKLELSLEKIATGEIFGEPKNYKDTLGICRNIAKDAIQ